MILSTTYRSFFLAKNLVLVFLSVIVLSCQNESDQQPKEKPLPNTPPTVANQWLQDYYNNHFAEAKKLSSKKTQVMIDTISAIVGAIGEEAISFRITDLVCDEFAIDSATCHFLYHELGLDVPDTISLIKINDQWLVDMELVSGDESLDESLEKFFEEFDEIK